MPLELAEAITQLTDARSPRRRAAAKRLRALADPAAGPPLLSALQREIRDPRTWETQYQMIMAVAMCGHHPALPLLQELALKPFDATSVYTALGDGIVRLGRDHPNDPAPVHWCLATGNDDLVDGALRAVAMLRLTLDAFTIARILNFVSVHDPYDHRGLRFWPAAAAAGWNGPRVKRFLNRCATSPRKDVADAAKASLQGRYKTYRPLLLCAAGGIPDRELAAWSADDRQAVL